MSSLTYFISYTTRTDSDVAWAKWVCWVLEKKLNAKTIIQEYDFQPGDNFKERMHDALKRANAVICILTHTYLESANCTEEWTNAKKIIPVRFDDCTPPGLLASRVYIDLYGLDRDSARDRLLTQLKGVVRPTYEPDAPFAPGSHDVSEEPEFTMFAAKHGLTEKHNLPMRNKDFTGREDILDEICKGLQESFVVSIVGAGGFGKTQDAVEYAYLHASEYDTIWCFNAESEIKLQEDYRDFVLRKLGLTENAKDEYAKKDFATIHRVIKEWFKENASYLLIYDNAEGCQNISSYLPYGQIQRHIIINSREIVQGVVSKRLNASVFSASDATDFVRKRIPDVRNDDAAILAKELGYLPLALECAVSYMEVHGYTPAQYLKRFNKHRIDVLNTLPNATVYDKTILTVWGTTFEKINQEAESCDKTKAALQLFRLCTYCAPEDIPLRMFIDGRNDIPSPLKEVLDPDNEPGHDAVIEVLTRYSLISMSRTDNSEILMTVHRLIQEAAMHNFEDNMEWIGCCLNIADYVIGGKFGTRDDFIAFSQSLPHAKRITEHAEKSFNGDESRIKTGRIFNNIGYGLVEQGAYTKALEWCYEALSIHEKAFSTDHPDTATTYNNIAYIYGRQGEYAKALEWHYKALAICEKVLGSDHTNTAVTNSNIASVYKKQGEYAKALEGHYKASAILERVLGLDHPYTATTYNNIAEVYNVQNDYDNALVWYFKALAIFERILGEEHPYTAITNDNIANVYRGQCEYAKALKWYYKALTVKEKVLGTEHPDTATTYNNIACVYYNQNDCAKALEWYNKALAIKEEALGAGHPDTATTYNNIACVNAKLGRFSEARDLFCRAVFVWTRCKLADHPNTISSYDSMRYCYEQAGGDMASFDTWFEGRMKDYTEHLNQLKCEQSP